MKPPKYFLENSPNAWPFERQRVTLQALPERPDGSLIALKRH